MSDIVVDRLATALADRYRIERELGRGGMATVFLAEDLKHHRQVAIKVLSPEVAAAIGPERFLREIETVARLTHPHILPLHDSGQAGALLYYVMPFVAGESLRDRLAREKQLPVEDALRIAAELADGLGHAHAQGIVHRDVKPENVLFAGGHALLADFGIARAVGAAGPEKLTQTGVTVGTPAYMSPEQAAGGSVDARSDQYALGCVVYEMLAGQPPFTGPTAESIAHQHLSVAPHPVTELRPTVTRSMATAIARALAKSPADRYANVTQFATALAEGARIPDAESREAPPRRWRRHRALLAVAAIIAVAIVAWLVMQREARPRAGSGAAMSPQSVTSLVALPCKVYGGQEVAYLADAVPATMSSFLGGIPGVTTKLPPASVDVEKVQGDLGRIARVMAVGTCITSSVVTDARHLSLNVQLVDATSRQVLWSRAFQGTPDAFLDIVQEAAQAIRRTLRPAAPPLPAATGPPAPSAAVLAYREGQFYSSRYNNRHEPADFERALRAFERSIALDSSYADAAVEISRLNGFRAEAGQISNEESVAQTRRWTALALRHDPQNGKAFEELTWAEMLGQAPDQERALELGLKGASFAPEDAMCQTTLGVVITGVSLDLAIACHDRARSLDPFYLYAGANLAVALEYQGRPAEALPVVADLLMVEPGFVFGTAVRLQALCMLGRTREAEPLVRQLQAAAAAGQFDSECARFLAESFALSSADRSALGGAMRHASSAIRNFAGLSAPSHLGLAAMLPFIARYAKRSESLDLLEAFARRWPVAPEYFEGQADFAPLRDDPRFSALLAASWQNTRRSLSLIERARGRGEVPDYLLPVLDQVRARADSARVAIKAPR